MQGINTQKSMLADSLYNLFFNDIEIGTIITLEKYFLCHVLGNKFKVLKSDKNKLKDILHTRYVEIVKECAESLGENLVWQSEVNLSELKVVERDGWKIVG